MPQSSQFDHHNLTELIYSAKQQIIERGKFYYRSGRILSANIEFHTRQAFFRVKGSDGRVYQVVINDITSPAVSASCTCPYDRGLCKHSVAALYFLRDRFEELLADYNQRYYPDVVRNKVAPERFDIMLEEFKKENIEEYEFGQLLYKYNHVLLSWYNPVFNDIFTKVEIHNVYFNRFHYDDYLFICTCGTEYCRHKVATLMFLKEFINSGDAKNRRKLFRRSKNGYVAVGRADEINLLAVNASLPKVLPQHYELVSLEQGRVVLSQKVRYRQVTTTFFSKDGLIYSTCTCDDKVPGLCKHQVAAINLFYEMNERFFLYLEEPHHIEDLKRLFV